MADDETHWRLTETLKRIAEGESELWDRLICVSGCLGRSGVSPETLMLGYFNECMRITTESRGVFGAYILATKLHWHVTELIHKLDDAWRAADLKELPTADSLSEKPE